MLGWRSREPIDWCADLRSRHGRRIDALPGLPAEPSGAPAPGGWRRDPVGPLHPGGARRRPHCDRPAGRGRGAAVVGGPAPGAHGFRVFRNHTMSHIDVKQDLSELTSLVEADADDPFILHPGEFVLGATLERVAAARRPGGPPGGQVVAGPPGPADPFDGGVRGPRLRRPAHPGAVECRQPADHPVSGDAHRPDQLPADDDPGRRRRTGRGSWARSTTVSAGPVPSRYWENFRKPGSGTARPAAGDRCSKVHDEELTPCRCPILSGSTASGC